MKKKIMDCPDCGAELYDEAALEDHQVTSPNRNSARILADIEDLLKTQNELLRVIYLTLQNAPTN